MCWLWTYFRLPEPKGRTYGELDVLFENNVSAKKFASTTVDQFSSEHMEVVAGDVEKITASIDHKE